jgi:superfamily II DNA or RNA helicase
MSIKAASPFSIRVVKMGHVIGKKGANINRLKEEYEPVRITWAPSDGRSTTAPTDVTVSGCRTRRDRQDLAREIIACGELAVPVPRHVFDALYRHLDADGLHQLGHVIQASVRTLVDGDNHYFALQPNEGVGHEECVRAISELWVDELTAPVCPPHFFDSGISRLRAALQGSSVRAGAFMKPQTSSDCMHTVFIIGNVPEGKRVALLERAKATLEQSDEQTLYTLPPALHELLKPQHAVTIRATHHASLVRHNRIGNDPRHETEDPRLCTPVPTHKVLLIDFESLLDYAADKLLSKYLHAGWQACVQGAFGQHHPGELKVFVDALLSQYENQRVLSSDTPADMIALIDARERGPPQWLLRIMEETNRNSMVIRTNREMDMFLWTLASKSVVFANQQRSALFRCHCVPVFLIHTLTDSVPIRGVVLSEGEFTTDVLEDVHEGDISADEIQSVSETAAEYRFELPFSITPNGGEMKVVRCSVEASRRGHSAIVGELLAGEEPIGVDFHCKVLRSRPSTAVAAFCGDEDEDVAILHVGLRAKVSRLIAFELLLVNEDMPLRRNPNTVRVGPALMAIARDLLDKCAASLRDLLCQPPNLRLWSSMLVVSELQRSHADHPILHEIIDWFRQRAPLRHAVRILLAPHVAINRALRSLLTPPRLTQQELLCRTFIIAGCLERVPNLRHAHVHACFDYAVLKDLLEKRHTDFMQGNTPATSADVRDAHSYLADALRDYNYWDLAYLLAQVSLEVDSEDWGIVTDDGEPRSYDLLPWIELVESATAHRHERRLAEALVHVIETYSVKAPQDEPEPAEPSDDVGGEHALRCFSGLEDFVVFAGAVRPVATAGHWHNIRRRITNCGSAKKTTTINTPAKATRIAVVAPCCPTLTPGLAALKQKGLDDCTILANYPHQLTRQERRDLAQRNAHTLDDKSSTCVARLAARHLVRDHLMNEHLFNWGSHVEIERSCNVTSKYGEASLDPWQHRVRMCLHEGRSALVCAPTSAGKTWLACRLIRELLDRNDEQIIVYICPTKALAKMVYDDLCVDPLLKHFDIGIFTRDLRVNDTNHRVLIAVPAIVSILVMSSQNGGDWKERIGMFIFDEVHCICEEANAATVERLFCLLQRPFLAFSATLAGRDRFLAWLNTLPGCGKVELIVSDARATEQQWVTPTGDVLHPWRLFEPLECADLDLAPDMPLQMLVSTTICFVQARVYEHPLAMERLNLPADLVATLSDWSTTSTAGNSRRRAETLLAHMGAIVLAEAAAERGLPPDSPLYFTRLHWKRVEGKLKQVVADISHLGLPSDYDEFIRHPLLVFFKRLKREHPLSWDTTRRGAQTFCAKAIAIVNELNLLPTIYFEQSIAHCVENAFMLASDPGEAFGFRNRCSCGSSTCDARVEAINTLQRNRDELSGQMLNLDSYFDALVCGVAPHHAKLPYKFKVAVETLLRDNHLNVVCATKSLAVGVHTPARSVVILNSPNMEGADIIQMAGRAGRRGIHDVGTVMPLGFSRVKLSTLFKMSLPDLRGANAVDVSFVLRSITMIASQLDLQRRAVDAECAMTVMRKNMLVQQAVADGDDAAGVEAAACELVAFSLDVLDVVGALRNGRCLPPSLLVERFDYLEPQNLALCALISRRALPTNLPSLLSCLDVLLRAAPASLTMKLWRLVERPSGGDDHHERKEVDNNSEGAAEAGNDDDDDDTSAASAPLLALKEELDLLVDEVRGCVLRSLRRQSQSNNGDWRSPLLQACGWRVNTLPPTLRRIDVRAGLRVVESLNTVLLIEQCRHVPYPSSLSVIAQNPRLFGVELWPRSQWAATWDALMTERDELKKFREVVMLTVQALCRDAVELAATDSGRRGDNASGALTQWRQRLLAISPGERIETPPPVVKGQKRPKRPERAPEKRLESMVAEYEYLVEIIAQCDLVRDRLQEFRVEPEASPVDLWNTAITYAPRPQPKAKVKVSKSEEEDRVAINNAWNALRSADARNPDSYERLLHSNQMAIVRGAVQLLGFVYGDAVHVIRCLRFEPEKSAKEAVSTLVIFSGGGPPDGTLPGLLRNCIPRAELSGTWLPMVEMMRDQVPWQVVIVPKLPDVISPSDVLHRLFETKQQQPHTLIVISELPWAAGVELYDSTEGTCGCFVQVETTTTALHDNCSSDVADRKGFVRFSFPASRAKGSLNEGDFCEIWKRIAESAAASVGADGLDEERDLESEGAPNLNDSVELLDA